MKQSYRILEFTVQMKMLLKIIVVVAKLYEKF